MSCSSSASRSSWPRGSSNAGRAVARALGAGAPAAGALTGWLTWRRAFAGGGLAFGALGVGVAAYMAMRLLGIGPLGTLVASGVLRTREPLILADFENRSTDSTLGPSLTAAFRVDLSESPTVRLLDAAAIGAALRRMERPAVTPLDAGLARELAERENVKAIVRGEIDPVGKGYVLSASLVAAQDGHVLAALRETATGDAALIGAVDRLSRKLRERIGESLKSIRASAPLEEVTTGSLDALRKYSEGVRAEEGILQQAIALYQDATALDTGFAMAHRKLAVVLGNTRGSPAAMIAATTRAFAHRDRLPEVERQLAMARYYEDVEYDPQRGAAAYRSVLERDPDHGIALNNLAFLLNKRRQWHEAESLAVRALSLGPSFPYVVNATSAQAGQGRYADARATLDRYARSVAPAARRALPILLLRSALEHAQGDYDAAERDARQFGADPLVSAAARTRANIQLALLHEVRGKLTQAARDVEAYMGEREQQGAARDYLVSAARLGSFESRYRQRPAAGARIVEAALGRHPLSSITALDRPYITLAEFYAEAGRPETAKQLLNEYERAIPEGIRRSDPERLAAAGALALAEGRERDAVAAFRAWTNEGDGPPDGLFELASAYDRAHQPDSARVVYEQLVSTPGLVGFFAGSELHPGDAHALPLTLKRLAELWEARGDRTRARAYYGRFVDLWRDADPELQPLVADARAALTRLSREPQ